MIVTNLVSDFVEGQILHVWVCTGTQGGWGGRPGRYLSTETLSKKTQSGHREIKYTHKKHATTFGPRLAVHPLRSRPDKARWSYRLVEAKLANTNHSHHHPTPAASQCNTVNKEIKKQNLDTQEWPSQCSASRWSACPPWCG